MDEIGASWKAPSLIAQGFNGSPPTGQGSHASAVNYQVVTSDSSTTLTVN